MDRLSFCPWYFLAVQRLFLAFFGWVESGGEWYPGWHQEFRCWHPNQGYKILHLVHSSFLHLLDWNLVSFFSVQHVKAACLWCWSLSKGDTTTFELYSSQESHFASVGGGEISWFLFRWSMIIHLLFPMECKVLWSGEIAAAFLRVLEVVFYRNWTTFC